MRGFAPFVLCLSLIATFSLGGFAQSTTLLQETGNNTAACSAAGTPSYCQAGFSAMSDSGSGTFNPAPGNVSTLDVHSLLYSGNTTRIFAYFEPWFCMNSGSTITGTGTLCDKHIQVGYNSNNTATVHGQLDDMLQRGFNGVIVDWYGTKVHPFYDSTTQLVRNDAAARCGGPQSCPLYFDIMYDQGSFQWTACPQNGGGVDQTQCIINAVNADFDYMNANYFNSNAYLRVDTGTMTISPTGRPVVLFFICEGCFTNPTPNWGQIWAQVRAHTNTYSTNTPAIYFVFRNGNGFTHVESNGAFAWVNWYGLGDIYGLAYLDNFYDTALGAISNNPKLMTFGAGWKGFDETAAPWITSGGRVSGQQCGQTWLQTWRQITHNNDFSVSHQLPFAGAVTWNDYEEGTEIETGIDNCLTMTASISGTTLSWTPNFASGGSESTVDHYVVFNSTDGTNLTQVATAPRGTHSLSLSTLSLPAGASTLYVKAVGVASVLNHLSNAVSYGGAPALRSVTVNPASVQGGQSSTGTVTLSAPAAGGGAVIGLSSNSPAATVPTTVTVAAGATSATFTVTTTTVTTFTTATITANYNGANATVALTVSPSTTATVTLSLNPSSVVGSNSSQGRVTLSAAAPSGGAVIALTSSNTAAAQVAATVTIPAGLNSAFFTISTSTVATATNVTITAGYNGTTSTAVLTVNPQATTAAAISGLTLSRTTVVGTMSSTGTVTLNMPAPSGGAIVALSTSNTAVATVPANVTVPAGSSSATFTVSTKMPTTTVVVTISGTLNGTKNATLTVLP